MNARSDISSTLLEPTFADAIEGIVAAEEVPQTRRTQLTCSLRKVAEWLQKGPGDVPAKWTSIRFAVGGLHHEQLGVVAKTLANHRSNVRAALAWFAGAADVPKRGAALTPAWAALRVQVSAHLDHTRLSPLMRFCSASGIAPQEVTESVIDRFMDYRAEHTRLTTGLAAPPRSGALLELVRRDGGGLAGYRADRAADPDGRHPMARRSGRSPLRH